MKKGISLTVLILIVALLFAGCSITSHNFDNKIKIVTTIFPEYDWVRNIAGPDNDRIDLTLLVDTGTDIHSYQPTAEDIVTLSTCDMLVYIGGESEEWLEDVIKNSQNRNMIVLNLLDILGNSAVEEEIKEGMETEHSDECPETPEYDEHIWLSLKNAVTLCNHIAEKLGALDPDNKELYSSNVKQYTDKLSALDEKYLNAVSDAAQRVVLFGDRFPFRYMFEDYGISYYAAFPGCSAETEASFKTIAYLSNKVDELGLKTIIKLENSHDSIATTIRDNTASKDQQILSLDSLQSTSLSDIESGKTYISVMESNLAILCEAIESEAKADYNTSISDASELFKSIQQIEASYLKSTQKGDENIRIPGPGTYNNVGFLIVSKEMKESYLSSYDFSEAEVIFPAGIDPVVTEFKTFNWCECTEFTRMILRQNFVGKVYFDTVNGIIFVNVQSA